MISTAPPDGTKLLFRAKIVILSVFSFLALLFLIGGVTATVNYGESCNDDSSCITPFVCLGAEGAKTCSCGNSLVKYNDTLCVADCTVDSSICKNDGACEDNKLCNCTSSYSGPTCEEFVNNDSTDLCEHVTCSHGNCSDGICICDYGWNGPLCGEQIHENINVGPSDPCENVSCSHGNCSEGICICDYGWNGPLCDEEIYIDPCENVNCGNGVCLNGECDCETGWTGDQCDISTSEQLPLDEAYYNIALLRERRDSYYVVHQDHLQQKAEMVRLAVKEKITVISEAVKYSEDDALNKFGIPQDQYDAILANKVIQYDNVVAVERELDNLILLTNQGFNTTFNNLKELVFASLNYLNDPQKWTTTKVSSTPIPLQINITNGFLPNYAVFKKVVRVRNRLSSGLDHGLYLHGNGKLYSWGVECSGCLGRSGTEVNVGYNLNINTPVELPNFSANLNVTILQFESSYYSNILLAGDAVYTWGRNDHGEVGDGTMGTHRVLPFKLFSWDLQGPQDVDQIAAGAYTFYAIKENGKLFAWGRNHRGQLGDKTTVTKTRPVDVYMNGSLSDQYVVRVCGGLAHTVVLTSSNRLYSFGDNTHGQLGLNYHSATEYKMEAVPVVIPSGLQNETIVDLKCGDDFTTILTESGKVFSWGRNDRGQLGTSQTALIVSIPQQIVMTNIGNGRSIVSLYSKSRSSFVMCNDGKWFSWGDNADGQLGISSTSTIIRVPTEVVGLPNNLNNHLITEITIMDKSTVGFTTDGAFVGTGLSSASTRQLMEITTGRTNFAFAFSFDTTTGFTLERRHYPYFETNDRAYQFIGDKYHPLVDNGFQLYYRNLSDPLNWDLVNYQNSTKRTFPGTIYNTHIARAQDYIYFYGGVVNGSISNRIYRAPVNDVENGWELVKNTLPYAVASGMSMVIDDYIYIYGGILNFDTSIYSVSDGILRAPINAPFAFEVLPQKLPHAVYGGNIAMVGEYIYIFGGRAPTQEAYSDILRAPYIFPYIWENTYSVLPFTYSDGPMVVTGDYIFIFGGYPSRGHSRSLHDFNYRVVFTPTSDPVGSWTVSGDVVNSLSSFTPTFSGSNLYLYGIDFKRIFSRLMSNKSHTMCTIPLLTKTYNK